MNNTKRYSKVLVLGMDGLDPRRVTSMVGDGELPSFRRLRDEGTLRALATSNPAESPVAWSSLATGCNPGRHGMFDFIHRNPKGYVPFLSTQREKKNASFRSGGSRFESPRRAPGFWRYTSDAGMPTTVVRWPVTFPAESVNGNFLAGLGVPDVSGRMGKHTFYTTGEVKKDDAKAVHVAWRGRAVSTHLFGPVMPGLTGAKPLRHMLRVEKSEGGVRLTVGAQRVELRPGDWSEWVNVRFSWGPVHICDAIVKFHLISVEPELRLFATPLQIDPRSQAAPLTQPASYGSELADRLGSFYTLGLPEDTHAVTDGRYDLDAFLQQCDQINGERRSMFEHELNRFGDGLLAFVFDAGDRIQHLFWCVDDPASPMFDPDRARKYGHVIADLYRDMDSLLATALDAVDDDTAVFVVSDHGFGPFHRAVHVNRWLIENGFMKLRGGAGEGRTLLGDVDWGRTKAYAVGFTSVYLNLAGRESCGIVTPGEQADSLRQELADGLCQVHDTANGQRVIHDVYAAREIYTGPHATEGPDLVIGFRPGFRASWQTALGAAPMTESVVDNDSLWSADHLVDPSAVPGILAANVGVQCAAPAGVDLAPTILHALDLPVPPHMEGQSWLDEAPVEPKPVHDEPALEPALATVETEACAPDGLDEQQRKQLEDHLSDLGYL